MTPDTRAGGDEQADDEAGRGGGHQNGDGVEFGLEAVDGRWQSPGPEAGLADEGASLQVVALERGPWPEAGGVLEFVGQGCCLDLGVVWSRVVFRAMIRVGAW